MFCTRCGKELPEGANVCPSCGERSEKEISFTDVKTFAGQKAQKASAGIQEKYQEFRERREKESESRKIDNVMELFVSADEQQKMEIKSGYLRNLFSGGGLSKAYGVLTDRRFYYRGRSYSKIGGRYLKSDEDCTIDIQDITSSGFVYTRRLWALIWAVVCLVASFFMPTIYSIMHGDILRGFQGSMMPSMILFLLFFPLITIYFFFKVTIYSITFAGGCLGINASFFDIDMLRDFDKILHQAKDARLTENRPFDGGNC